MCNVISDIDTKTAAKKWGVTANTVAKYCADGLVPGAVKIKKAWKIPYDSIKPLTLDNIFKLLRLVDTLKHYPELDIDYEQTGLLDINIERVFRYLVLLGMVQSFNTIEPTERIPYSVRLTQRSLDIIANSKKSKNSIDNDLIIKMGAAVIVEIASAIIKSVA